MTGEQIIDLLTVVGWALFGAFFAFSMVAAFVEHRRIQTDPAFMLMREDRPARWPPPPPPPPPPRLQRFSETTYREPARPPRWLDEEREANAIGIITAAFEYIRSLDAGDGRWRQRQWDLRQALQRRKYLDALDPRTGREVKS